MSEDWEYEARAGGLKIKLYHCKEFLSDTVQHNFQRLTGAKLRPSMARDLTRLVISLYQEAMQAGVPANCPEMKHFSRWTFLLARQAGAMGLNEAAKQCFDLSVQSAGRMSNDLRIYQILSNTLGWRCSGMFFCWIDEVLKRRTGPHTQKQSWMEK